MAILPGNTMNKIVVNFTPCAVAPSNGYQVKWREKGTLDSYTDAGNFFVSPAIFYDSTNPAGTLYEGYIRADCGGSFGPNIPWETFDPESSGYIPGPVNGNIIVDDCGKGMEIQAMRFNGENITAPFFISEGESETAVITTPALNGTLEIDVVGHAGVEDERIEVTDSNGNHQCQTMFGNDTYTFLLFDVVEDLDFSVHIYCGDVCP